YLATRLDVYRRVRYQITAAKTTRNRVSEACCLPFRVRRSDSVRRVTCCARVAVAAEIALVGFVGAKITLHEFSVTQYALTPVLLSCDGSLSHCLYKTKSKGIEVSKQWLGLQAGQFQSEQQTLRTEPLRIQHGRRKSGLGGSTEIHQLEARALQQQR